MIQDILLPEISHIIRAWYSNNHRELPWRETHDAYRIWLSEIILQQTRVAQGMDYYLRFVEAFPSVQDLAEAPIDQVMKLWQGLGYYSRARNLHAAAQQVMTTFGGHFPNTYKELIMLKGVGPYTAAAIASFSSGEAVAAIDGNVYRVLSRLFDIDTPCDSNEGIKLFASIANQILPPDDAGQHNQAMMEFGALHCTPTSPLCAQCPLQDRCQSFNAGTTLLRPVKKQKIKIKERYLHYLILMADGKFYIHKRQAGDIWEGLYEFIQIEKDKTTPAQELLPEVLEGNIDWKQLTLTSIFTDKTHKLTHQTLHVSCYLVQSPQLLPLRAKWDDFFAISASEWAHFAVPKIINDANNELFRILSCNSQNNV